MVVEEFKHDPSFVAWGPFVPAGFRNESITQGDIIIASIVWGLTCLSAIQALYLAWGQTTASRSPLRSIYVWLIWIELAVCSIMGLECYLHLLKFIKPSKLKRDEGKPESISMLTITQASLSTVPSVSRQWYADISCLVRAERTSTDIDSVLVVHPGPTPSANHHQPYPRHHSGSSPLKTHHDRNSRCRYCD